MVSSQTERIGRAASSLRRSRLAASLAFAAQGLLFAVLLTHVPQFKGRFSLGDGAITLVILTVSVIAGAGSVSAEGAARRWSSRMNIFNYLGSIVGGVAVGGIGTASSLRYGFIVPAVLALALLLLAPAFNPSKPSA